MLVFGVVYLSPHSTGGCYVLPEGRVGRGRVKLKRPAELVMQALAPELNAQPVLRYRVLGAVEGLAALPSRFEGFVFEVLPERFYFRVVSDLGAPFSVVLWRLRRGGWL